MSGEIVDLTKLARRAVRKARAHHNHVWVEGRTIGHSGRRGAIERCACGDQFPCRGYKCEHLDCIERGYAIGQRRGFPRDYSHSLVVLGDGHVSGDLCVACVRGGVDDHYAYYIEIGTAPAAWITAIPLEPERRDPT